ncbi:hypothetical protein Hanom_Chr04g00318471 [Helianthus anomalus]
MDLLSKLPSCHHWLRTLCKELSMLSSSPSSSLSMQNNQKSPFLTTSLCLHNQLAICLPNLHLNLNLNLRWFACHLYVPPVEQHNHIRL